MAVDVRTGALRWVELEASRTAEQPTAVLDVLGRNLDGITVAAVLSEAEAARAVERLERHRQATTPAMFGSMLGTPLADLDRLGDDLSDRTPYLDEAERCRGYYREAFGFDPHERIAEVLTPMAGGRAVEPPREGGRPYNPGNVRWFEPGSGGLPAHVGNEFALQHDATTSHLRTTTTTRDHLSYFLILQAPESGGGLSIYDLVHDRARPGGGDWTEDGRDDRELAPHVAKLIPPRPGDLLLFGGGWRWHRVDEIGGSRPRVTYGGFGGPSLDGRSVHLWF
ncbi:MAG TPA: hypothetical protein VD926_00580 [Acidimicrobiales bacterium]|nr:hypothetical protein [Acidimicrobiales bacterium]